MPAFPVPAALKLFSGGILFGGFWSPPEDYTAPNLGWGVRFGLVLEQSPFEVELTAYSADTTLRSDDVGIAFSVTRADLLFKLFDAPRVHILAGPGVGWRYVHLSELDSALATAHTIYGLTSNPIADLVLSAGGGVRVWLVGPVHLRADVQGLLQLGDQPASEPLHVWPGVLGTVALDLRYEPPPDGDRDGVPDKSDLCPKEKEDLDFFDDGDGCIDPDDDRDGIPDVSDLCKDQAEDMDGFEDTDGCADHNNDHDAFPDAMDQCPDEPETQNGWEDGDGCAEVIPAEVSAAIGTRTDLTFEGEALGPESVPQLEALADLFQRYPDMRARITVYTDNADGVSAAVERSRAQALVLHTWLLAHGVALDRLAMTAGGSSVPVGSGGDAADQPTNRRVVISLFDPVDGDGSRLPIDAKSPDKW
jgi:outer membrane protein OmpA-like peptidoglycan-associated protein